MSTSWFIIEQGHREHHIKNIRIVCIVTFSYSDEEDEPEIEKDKYNVANAETDRMFDGQEKATITFDGETKITAFNMEEEMQQGHFDKEGTFIFKKEKEEIKDSWLDNIDWVSLHCLHELAKNLQHIWLNAVPAFFFC